MWWRRPSRCWPTTTPGRTDRSTSSSYPSGTSSSLTTLTRDDEPLVRELLAVVQRVAAQVESKHGAAAVLTNLGEYQDSKHLHVHVMSGGRV